MLETCQPELVTTQLDRIVSSPPLSSSPSLCRFLRYVVEETLAGRSGSLKEYSLGVVVFERGDEFDPRLDPIVRVQARNLRVRLAQYYAGAGADDPVLIELPKRTYVPVFQSRAETPEPQPAEPEALAAAAEEAACEPVADIPAEPAFTAPLVVSPSAQAPTVAPAVPPMLSAPVVDRPAWYRPRWAFVGAAVVITILGTTAFWRFQPAESARKQLHDPDPAAQDLYIRGRYLIDRQTEPAIRESIEAFNSAIDRDPQFAPAYAGLADAYNVLAQYGYITPKEGMEQARHAAERAIQIDPQLAEGHVSLAAIIEAYDWNWAGAEREYRRAVTLNPALPAGHLWFGMFLRDQGRLQEALPELRRAAQLDPISAFTAMNLAHAYMIAGNYSEAEEQARHAAELAPELVAASVLLSNVYRAESRPVESDAVLLRARQFSTGNPHAISLLACAYARRGQREESLRLFQELEGLAKQRYVSPFDLGTVSLVLGDDKQALALLEEAFRQRSSGLIFLRDAKFKHSPTSPGIESLIERMHFAG